MSRHRTVGPRFWRQGIAIVLPLVTSLAFSAVASPLCATRHAPSDDQKNQDSGTARLQIVVTGGKDNKPVGNASVYVRYPEKPGSAKLVEMDLKTDDDGHVKVPEIPRGKVMVQVVAPHWNTYGKWYDVEQAEEVINIQLGEVTHWY